MGRRDRRAAHAVVTWQDKRSQEAIDRLEADGSADAVRERSGMPLDPYFSAGKLTWLLEHDDAVAAARERGTCCGSGPSTRSSATGSGPASPPTRRRPRGRSSARRAGTRSCSTLFGVPLDALPPVIADTVGELGTLQHPIVAGRAAAARALRRPAGGARRRGLRASRRCRRPPTAPASSCSPTSGASAPGRVGGLLPTVAWRVDGEVEWALDGGVFTAGALLEWLSRDLGPGGRPAGAGGGRGDGRGRRRACVCCRRWPGIGAPWWRADARGVIAGLTAGVRPAPHRAARALEAIAWRVADIVEAVREEAPVEALRVDGGLTRDPLLLQLQADTAGVPVQRGAVDATAAGAAALAAVGAGLWSGTPEIGERIPAGEVVKPSRDASWREGEHEAWRRFVQRALALSEE